MEAARSKEVEEESKPKDVDSLVDESVEVDEINEDMRACKAGGFKINDSPREDNAKSDEKVPESDAKQDDQDSSNSDADFIH